MKKIAFIVMGSFFICAIANTNIALGFSITKPAPPHDLLNHLQGDEFIKLTFKQFAAFTGEKINLRNNLSFNIMKMKVRHDLKKNPDLSILDYNLKRSRHGLRIGLWIVIGVVALILIIRIIAGPFN
ncbi:MAG: hypothetical protein ABJA57_13515 [Ginsengibacter sp.]